MTQSLSCDMNMAGRRLGHNVEMTSDSDADLDAILARRSILEWRDRHLLAGQHTLLQLSVDLEREFFGRIDQLEWSELTGDVDDYVTEALAPLVSSRASQAVSKLVAVAEIELRTISADAATVVCELDEKVLKSSGSDAFAWLIPDRLARELPSLGTSLSRASEKPAALAGAALNSVSRMLSKTPVDNLAASRRKTYRDGAQALITSITIGPRTDPPSALDRFAAALRTASGQALKAGAR
jgi:hypothetical protein